MHNGHRPPNAMDSFFSSPTNTLSNASSNIHVHTGALFPDDMNRESAMTPESSHSTLTQSQSSGLNTLTVTEILKILVPRIEALEDGDLALLFQHVYFNRNKSDKEFFKVLHVSDSKRADDMKEQRFENMCKEIQKFVEHDYRYGLKAHMFLQRSLVDVCQRNSVHPGVLVDGDAIVKNSLSIAKKYVHPFAEHEDLMSSLRRTESLCETFLVNDVHTARFQNPVAPTSGLIVARSRSENRNSARFEPYSLHNLIGTSRGYSNEMSSTNLSSPSEVFEYDESARTAAFSTENGDSTVSDINANEKRKENLLIDNLTSFENNDDNTPKRVDGSSVDRRQIERAISSIQEPVIVESEHLSQTPAADGLTPTTPANDVQETKSTNLVTFTDQSKESTSNESIINNQNLDASSNVLVCPEIHNMLAETEEANQSGNGENPDQTRRTLNDPINDPIKDDVISELTEKRVDEPKDLDTSDGQNKDEQTEIEGNVNNSEETMNDQLGSFKVTGKQAETLSSSKNGVQNVNVVEDGKDRDQEAGKNGVQAASDGQVQRTDNLNRPKRILRTPHWIGVDQSLRDTQTADDDDKKTTSKSRPRYRRRTVSNGRPSRSKKARKTDYDNSIEEQQGIQNNDSAATSSSVETEKKVSSAEVETTAACSSSNSMHTEAPFVLNLNLYKKPTEDSAGKSSEMTGDTGLTGPTAKPKRVRSRKRKENKLENNGIEKTTSPEMILQTDSKQAATSTYENHVESSGTSNHMQPVVMHYPEPTHTLGFSPTHTLPGDPYSNTELIQHSSSSLHYPMLQYNSDFQHPPFNTGFQFNAFVNDPDYSTNYPNQSDLYYNGNV